MPNQVREPKWGLPYGLDWRDKLEFLTVIELEEMPSICGHRSIVEKEDRTRGPATIS